ncbi:MAG TPA: class I SAM-dependent methyltransferase [Bacteroidales bacterium]|nr:class I SAM-dependent methyltransferase [Bacteroidales bacterium]
MKFHKLIKYLQYWIFSRHSNGHGIHSPFIFNIVSELFRNKSNDDIVCTIEKVRETLIRDKRIIRVHDLGSGQNKKQVSRKVSEIARYSAVTKKYGLLLSNLAAEFGRENIIELGTSLGISTMYLASGCPGTAVHTIEGCPECSDIARDNISGTGFENVHVITGSFDEKLPALLAEGIKPGLVFIDGNHRYSSTIGYFNMIMKISDEQTVFVFDDIHNSVDMSQAWVSIINDERVTATIDIHRMGIVFLKKGITKGNYTIRY